MSSSFNSAQQKAFLNFFKNQKIIKNTLILGNNNFKNGKSLYSSKTKQLEESNLSFPIQLPSSQDNKNELSQYIGEIINKIKKIQVSIQELNQKEKEIILYYEKQKNKINSLFLGISTKIENIKRTFIEKINFLYNKQEKSFLSTKNKISCFTNQITRIQNLYEQVNCLDNIHIIESSKEQTNLELDNIIKEIGDYMKTTSNLQIFPYFLPPCSVHLSNYIFGEIKYTNNIGVEDDYNDWLNMSECLAESKDFLEDTYNKSNTQFNQKNIFNNNLLNEGAVSVKTKSNNDKTTFNKYYNFLLCDSKEKNYEKEKTDEFEFRDKIWHTTLESSEKTNNKKRYFEQKPPIGAKKPKTQRKNKSLSVKGDKNRNTKSARGTNRVKSIYQNDSPSYQHSYLETEIHKRSQGNISKIKAPLNKISLSLSKGKNSPIKIPSKTNLLIPNIKRILNSKSQKKM